MGKYQGHAQCGDHNVAVVKLHELQISVYLWFS